MEFAYNEDQQLLRETTRRFLDRTHPLSGLRSVMEADEVVDRAHWKSGAELGWTAMLVPAEYGGGSLSDQPVVDLVALAEELGRVLYPGPFIGSNVVIDAAVRSGSQLQRDELLPGLLAGDLLGAWGMTADGSAEVSAVGVQATRDGDSYRLSGSVRFVHAASAADVLLLAATSVVGLSWFLVPTSSAGVSMRNLAGLDLTRRFADVELDDVRLPLTEGVGLPGHDAEELLERLLGLATVLQAGEMVGAAEYLLHATVEYAKVRVQFGRPIGSFQALKHRLADGYLAVEGMRAAARYAALAFGDGYLDAAEAVAVAGSSVADAFAHLCGEALQLHGGIGFTWEHDVHLFLRRAKTDQALYGEPSWHRERLCRLVEQTVDAGEVR